MQLNEMAEHSWDHETVISLSFMHTYHICLLNLNTVISLTVV